MIDIKELQKNPDHFSSFFKRKKYDLTNEIKNVLSLYETYLKHLRSAQALAEELNKKSKGKISEQERIELKKLSDDSKIESKQADELMNKIQEIMSYWPNIPFEEVKVGNDENDNVEIEKHNCEHKVKHNFHHQDIIVKKNLMFIEESANISGARHLFYKGQLLELLIALEKFMLDLHKENNWMLTEPPVIVNAKALWNTGQLPKFEMDLFKLTNDQYLIPTAEVPLTNLFENKLFDEKELPIKLTALTNCFRSEAGSAGKDTKGMIRVHQFRKVELVSAGLPSSYKNDLNEMLRQATKILDLLKLPYRIVELCTGDMGFASAKTFDIEVWLPAQDKYREISSVSCCTNFQARRLNSKYKNNEGKKDFIYTYNGSALALERTIAAIIENYYDASTNKVKVPSALQKYLPFNEF